MTLKYETHKLQDMYMIATPLVGESLLRGSLILLYQCEGGMASGLVINKPEDRLVSDYLVKPGALGQLPVWYGGPIATDRLIAVSQTEKGLFITDRLMSLTPEQQQSCLIVAGQCVWTESLLQEQIEQGAWVLVANHEMIPRNIPAKHRIRYVMDQAGWNLERYIHPQDRATKV